MSNLPMDTFNREVVTINRELKKFETQDGPVTGYDLIAKWNIARAKISHLLNKLGAILFDQDFLPACVQKEALPAWDASTSQTTPSLPLPQIWDNLTKAISGKYTLAYDFTLLQVQLEVTAQRFQLSIPVLIGESILDLYFAYHGINVFPTPEDPKEAFLIPTAFYDQLGTPFSREAPYTAKERATRILHILQGIADCTLTVPSQSDEK